MGFRINDLDWLFPTDKQPHSDLLPGQELEEMPANRSSVSRKMRGQR